MQFAGRQLDPSTGLYHGERFYSPATKRFIAEDAFPGIKEDPTTDTCPMGGRSRDLFAPRRWMRPSDA